MKSPKKATTTTPSLQIKNEIRQFLARRDSPSRALLFLGAGAGNDLKAPEDLRLPLGADVMDRLLKARYGEVDPEYRIYAETEARRRMFKDDNPKVKLTPDNVWERLIQESGEIREFHPILEELFSRQKPIPPTYYMCGRWLLGSTSNTCVVTTNYDEHLDRAFQEIASILGKDADSSVHISAVRDDFAALYTADHGRDSRILKVHGTLSHPWSIIAGDKATALRIQFTKGKPDWQKDPRYVTMESALFHHKTWVFVGFSFADSVIPEVIKSALSRRRPDPTNIFVVGHGDLSCAEKVFRGLGKRIKLRLVRWTAEEFFQYMLECLEDNRMPPSGRLSVRERQVLQEGAAFPGCPKGHLLGTRGDVDFDDIVHGSIKFSTHIEKQLIRLVDSGEVQRLRNIKQLSFVNLKYAGAVHDRFGHVLGVTCLADKLFTSLREKPSEDREIRDRLHLEDSDHLAFCGAALLHDIGHGPFGHAMDLVRDEIKWQPSHEDDSKAMLKMADKNDSFGDLGQAIRDANMHVTEIWSVFQAKDRAPAHPMKAALATDDSLDIDRLDFIVRDALYAQPSDPKSPRRWVDKALAVQKSMDEIVRGMAPCIGPSGEIEFRYRLQHEHVLRHAAELYTHLYENVYYCWENISAQHMLRIAVSEVLKTSKYRFNEILPTVDGELIKILEDFDHPHVRDLTYMIKNRRLYPPLFRASVRPTEAVYRDPNALKAWRAAFKSFAHRLKIFCAQELKASPFALLCDVKGPRVFPVIFGSGTGKREPKILATMPGLIQIIHWPMATLDRATLERWLHQELVKFDKNYFFRSWLSSDAPKATQVELPIM